MADRQAALDAFSAVVGAEHVSVDEAELAAAATTTYRTEQRVAAIVRPASTAEVQACMRVANEHRVAVYPTSKGKNWGYGSRVPPGDDNVLLDLGRMNQIIELDEELAYVTVEPGVTQQQIYDLLQERGGRLWIDATGSSPEGSVLGNIIERGFGVTPYGDHTGKACGYEVVLPNGDVIHTGFGRFAGAKSAPLDRYGPGPLLEGLFSQSNLGIVTGLSVWLMPAPESALTAVWDMPNPASLGEAVDAMRRLQLDGTIRAAPWFANHYRLLAVVMQYPGEIGTLTPAASRKLARSVDIAPFTGAVGLYGTPKQIASHRSWVRAALRGKVRRLRFVEQIPEDWKLTPSKADDIEAAMHRGYTGKLMDAVFRSYWRKPAAPEPPFDPDLDGVGFVFCPASLPFRGTDVTSAFALAQEIVVRHGFEPQVNCHSIRDRVLQWLCSIAYDRDIVGEDDSVRACHDELAAALLAAGYPPFRLGLHSMRAVDQGEATYNAALRTIKAALDPNGVLAPGRYEPTAST